MEKWSKKKELILEQVELSLLCAPIKNSQEIIIKGDMKFSKNIFYNYPVLSSEAVVNKYHGFNCIFPHRNSE